MGSESALPCSQVMSILLILGITGEWQGPEVPLTGKGNEIFQSLVERKQLRKCSRSLGLFKQLAVQDGLLFTKDKLLSLEKQTARGREGRGREKL